MKPGYNPVSIPDQDSTSSAFNLHPVTWRLLRLFLHLPLYLKLTIEEITIEELKEAFKDIDKERHPFEEQNKTPFSFLDGHIKTDIKMLYNQLSSFGNDSIVPWLYYVLNQFIPKFTEFQENPTTIEIRK